MNKNGQTKIASVGYVVEKQWECEFDRDIFPQHPELKTHPIVQHSPEHARCHVRASKREHETPLQDPGG
jgi:hypothetical protein